jgi:hypothetical protein
MRAVLPGTGLANATCHRRYPDQGKDGVRVEGVGNGKRGTAQEAAPAFSQDLRRRGYVVVSRAALARSASSPIPAGLRAASPGVAYLTPRGSRHADRGRPAARSRSTRVWSPAHGRVAKPDCPGCHERADELDQVQDRPRRLDPCSTLHDSFILPYDGPARCDPAAPIPREFRPSPHHPSSSGADIPFRPATGSIRTRALLRGRTAER